jgi:hypothetical protein
MNPSFKLIQRGGVILLAGAGLLLAVSPARSEGVNNSGTGAGALDHIASGTGKNNTADGDDALYSDENGDDNTATGLNALYYSTGVENTADGQGALKNSTTASENTAVGFQALISDTSGGYNSALGYAALYSNLTGVDNTAIGYDALHGSTAAFLNTAIGFETLFSNKGNYNTALGHEAGAGLTTGSNNIDISDATASGAADDKAGESNTIRIGELSTQKATYIAGIYSATVASGDKTVIIDATGKLGTAVAPATASLGNRDLRDALVRLADGNKSLKAIVAVQAKTLARQQDEIQALTASLKQQASMLEKVSARMDASRSSPQVAANDN